MTDNTLPESIISKHSDPLFFYKTAPQNARIAIYGTGKAGETFHQFISTFRPDIVVVFYVDSFTTGTKDGLQVVKVDQLAGRNDYDFIAICSVAHREIEGILIFFSIKKYIVIGQSAKYSSRYYSRHKAQFSDVISMLYTEQDRDLYRMLLNYSCNYDLLHKSPDTFCKYIDTIAERDWYIDYIDQDRVGIAVDGGAFCGDSADHFTRNLTNLKKLYCFEISFPVEKFYAINKHFVGDDRIEFHGLGLSDEIGEQYILGGQYHTDSCGDSLSKDTTNCKPVACTTLDAFCKDKGIEQIDYIKMDIEGSELEALHGCKSTIEKYRPQLAICIYHDLDDMWAVPLLMKSLCKNYIFRLNQYSHNLNETVMYAIPKELYIDK